MVIEQIRQIDALRHEIISCLVVLLWIVFSSAGGKRATMITLKVTPTINNVIRQARRFTYMYAYGVPQAPAAVQLPR